MIIGICEDNAQMRAELKQEIEKQQTDVLLQIYSFDSAEAMLQSKLAFDLVFLDIELNGSMTGLELAKQLQDQLLDLMLVFVSGHTQYISSAFRLRTFQFLLKPLDHQLFREEFARCIAQYRLVHDVFHLQQSGDQIDIPMKEIVYLESDKRKIKVYLKDGQIYEMYGKISEYEQVLSDYYFIRTHKSFLVNCRYIKKMKDETVWVGLNTENDLQMLPISRRCKSIAQEQYHRYLMGGGK